MSEQLELFGRYTRLTFEEACPIYWELEGRRLRGRSHKSDVNRLARYFRDKFLHDLIPFDIESYREDRKTDYFETNGKILKDSTLNKEHARITRMLNAFKEWKRAGKVGGYDFKDLDLPLENPGELVPQTDESMYKRNLVITPEMFAHFIDYAHPRVRRICTIAILTLLRRKDIRLLTNDNLNGALSTLSGTQSKTGKPYNIPAPLSVKIIFREAREEERNYICDFTNFDRYFIRARKESGIYFQFRDLRRSGATEMLLNNIDIRTIQRYLGHADISMTETYLSPPPKMSQEAARIVEEKFVTRVPLGSYEYSEN